MPTLLQSVHSATPIILAQSDIYPDHLPTSSDTPNRPTTSNTYALNNISALASAHILTPSGLYIPISFPPDSLRSQQKASGDILDAPWPDVRKAVQTELNTLPTAARALLKNSSTLSQFFGTSRHHTPLLYALHRELLTSIPALSDLPVALPSTTLRFVLCRLALFDDFLPDHLHFLPISPLFSLIIYLSAPTFASSSRVAAPQDQPVLFLARRHLINLRPDEQETLVSLPENPALYIIRRLAKRHLPNDQDLFHCLDRLAKVRYHKRQ